MRSVFPDTRALRRSAIIAGFLASATAFGPVSAAHAAPRQNSAPTTIPTLAVLSPEQYASVYAAKLGKPAPKDPPVSTSVETFRTESGKLVVTDDKTTSTSAPVAGLHTDRPFDPVGGTPWYTIEWSDTDRRGTYVPTRFGNNSLGYLHYSGPAQHNLITQAPFRVIRNTTNPIVSQGAHLEYQALLTNLSNGSIQLKVRIVVQAASRTDDGQWITPDGRNIGTITAYCEGYNQCPSWVNQL